LTIREIGFGERAFEKLDFGKTDIQKNGFRKMDFGKLDLRTMDFGKKEFGKTDFGRFISGFWAVTYGNQGTEPTESGISGKALYPGAL